MFKLKYLALLALLPIALLTSSLAFADNNTDKTGLALQGYDPVSYFTEKKAVRGDFQITATHDGAVYRFKSEKHKTAFLKNPSKYLPEYGGYCAFGVALGAKFTADPTVFVVKDGKLYLNLNTDIATKFNSDLNGSIDKADKAWRTLASKPVTVPE